MAFGIVLATSYAAYLVLQSCGVRLPLFNYVVSVCATDAAVADGRRLETLDGDNLDLARQISRLERELALRQCTAQLPPEDLPPAFEPDGMDPEAFAEQDISLLEGCWVLDSAYSTVNRQTGRTTNYNEWTICFDANGAGRETMRATDGATCEGPLQGEFNSQGALMIVEPQNLGCSNGTFIYRREMACSVDAVGNATCDGTQPEYSGNTTSSTTRLRRAQGVE